MNSQLVRAQYDWTATRPSIAIVETIATATDRAPTDLRPLYSVVDPEALDSLVDAGRGAIDDTPVRLSFRYAGRDVTVRSDGRVVVECD